ncbi:hypothetical protein EXU57_15080 [Segetibacter sp. 3557_3]|uniref:hypothetical protein n=1 Tax=Segetibacter sp. 3557_3 TaxID=2547429 RepID=UPI001058E6A0|nr:hypothetical protein [Segetibacter sp. 3557_3]TDH24657.1 hypothetical protein EXU57_15080 [Segetibacter sp. 3557_3]
MNHIKGKSILLACVVFTCVMVKACMNKPAESISTDSSANAGPFDTTAAQVVLAPHDSLAIAVRDVIARYPGVAAEVHNGEVTLTGNIEGKKIQYLVTDITTLRPKKLVNQLKVYE